MSPSLRKNLQHIKNLLRDLKEHGWWEMCGRDNERPLTHYLVEIICIKQIS
jgi:hypothetical protein